MIGAFSIFKLGYSRKNKIRSCFCITLGVAIGLLLTVSWAGAAEHKKFKIYMVPDHVYPTYEEVFRDFEKQYGYKIELEKADWTSMRPKIFADFAAGTPPDLLEVRPPWSIEFGLRGFLTDLTERLSQWPGYKDWFESNRNEPSYKGRFYGVKLHATCMMLFWNRSLFRKTGLDPDNPPKTWGEMLEMTEILTRDLDGDGFPDQYGSGMGPVSAGSDYMMTGWLEAAHIPYFTEDGKWMNLDNPEAIKLGKFLQQLKEWSYLADPGAPLRSVSKMFASKENIGMVPTGPWDINAYQEVNPDFDFSIGHIPVPKGTDYETSLHGTHIAIPKGTKTTDDAFQLIKMLTATEVEVETTKRFGQTFPRKSWAEHPDIKKMLLIGKIGSIMETAVPYFAFQVVKQIGTPKAAGKIGRELLREVYERIVYLEEEPALVWKDFTQKANQAIKEERGS